MGSFRAEAQDQCGSHSLGAGCHESHNACRLLAFAIPFVLVLVINSIDNWLETPLFTVGSMLNAAAASLAPALLGGFTGGVLYATIKQLKRMFRCRVSGSVNQ